EYFAPYVDRVFAGETSALFRRRKVLMFAMTSGTSAARKYVPVTKDYVRAFRKGWYLWALSTYEGRQHLIFRDKFNFSGDDAEFRSPAGVPCGSISGMVARTQSLLVRRTYCLPLAANKLCDTHAKYYLAWRVGLTRDVGSWMSPNPSTHLALARFGDAHKERLIRDVRDGTLAADFGYPKAVLRELRRTLRPDPRRAAELEAVVRRTGHLYPKDVWPRFGLIGCWLGGPLTAYLRFFPEYFGDVPKRDLGLIASECRMTIPLEDDTPAGVLDLFGTFFEFVPADEIDGPDPTVLLPHELTEGRDYYVLLTTPSGLYRYDIRDVVRCVGFHGRTPLIEFLHKGKHFSNLTGEKVSEIQVARAADAACDRLRLRLASYALAPCFEEDVPYYGLFVELDELPDRSAGDRLAARIDTELRRANCEYDAKRASLRLGPVRLRPLAPGAWAEFDRRRLRKTGATAEQYKRPRLFADLGFAASLPVLPGSTMVPA
ncbi:MAG TPA: GH3 auxin-responsive promoter family protein, partial [Planctomycetaceae bacterium]